MNIIYSVNDLADVIKITIIVTNIQKRKTMIRAKKTPTIGSCSVSVICSETQSKNSTVGTYNIGESH